MLIYANISLSFQHRQTHQPRDMECYGCRQTFKSFSGMLIHLESGACPSDADEDMIDDIARDCDRSSEYIIDQRKTGGWGYVCWECEREFGKLSALYQHAEDVSECSDLMEGAGCLADLQGFIQDRIEELWR